nr:hypothetical protein [Mesoaciditoga lauensis]
MGIERNEKWIPIPTSNEKIQIGDKIALYGKRTVMRYGGNPSKFLDKRFFTKFMHFLRVSLRG